jgi:serine/threonine protein kinase
MGRVSKAFGTQRQRTVALRFLTPDPADIVDRERLLREAQAASTLDHKNIARVHAVEESRTHPFRKELGKGKGWGISAWTSREWLDQPPPPIMCKIQKTKDLEGARREISLAVMAYNLKRMLKWWVERP